MNGGLVAFALLVSGSALIAAEGQDSAKTALMEGLIGAGAFWEQTPDQFMTEYRTLGFRWTSASKDSARVDGKSHELTAFGKRIGETILSFDSDHPKMLQVSLYNRGDDGEIQEEQFKKLLQFWGEKLNEVTQVQGERRGRDSKSAVRTEGMLWTAGSTVYLLESSAEKRPFRAEFIRLRVAKIVKKGFMEEKLAKEDRTAKADLPANVKKKDGDVIIAGIPMVDQGQKGYCVVASAARVFGYYGMQVDQHEIAQISDASSAKGTSMVGMLDALHRMAGRFKVRVKVDYDVDVKGLKDLMSNYNRLAKRAGKREVPENPAVYDVTEIFTGFDPDLLKDARLKDKSGFKRFKSEVQGSVDSGVPLLWSLVLGIYPEPKLNLQTKGGHMRLIIGYNWEKNEIIYSDSWGAGHEIKRCGAEEAFSCMTGLYSVLPTV